jgi:hypothetical protein
MIARQVTAMVETHCAALEAAADNMASVGIGCAPVVGHADRLRKMAFDMRAEAAAGVVPSSYKLTGAREMVEATPAVIAAALERPDVKQVQHLLRRYGIEITKVDTVEAFDIKLRAQAMPLSDRIVLKSSLLRAGLTS